MTKLVKKWLALPLAALLVAALALTACGTPTASTTPTQLVNLTGAGATFPQYLYAKWFDEYNKLTGVEVNYQPIGSGGGINAITAGTVDFGASDGIMSTEQEAAAVAAGGPVLHIPMTSGAVAIIYNLSGIGPGELKLTPDVLADIYLKTITRWNDARIAALNPTLALPDQAIAVVHRSDGSGTTYIFTNYLSKVSARWQTEVGNATSVSWPGDIGAEKSAGVAGQVQQLPGAIGYVELAYALQNDIGYARLQNQSGNFVLPTLESTTAAAEGVTLPDDMRVMLTDSANPEAYPIVGFTWLLVFVNQADGGKGATLVDLLWWAIHDGQQYAAPLDYAPLASGAVTKAENEIRQVKYQGQPLLDR